MPFGVGHIWILVILGIIALIIFGPSRLPELGAGLGRAIREFRKGASEMSDSFKEEFSKPGEGQVSAPAASHGSGSETPATPGTSGTPGAAPPQELPKG